MEIVEKTKAFSREVAVEVRKVSWPDRKELQDSTLLVILSVFIIMIFIYGVDRVFSSLVGLVLK